jgi:hypothetical protein
MSLTYLYVFLQSNLLEVPIYYLFFRRQETPWQSLQRVTLINSLTHPIVFFVIMNLEMTYLQNILAAELFAIMAETLYFALVFKRSASWSFLAALIANLVSWQLAPVLTYLISMTVSSWY